MLSLQIQQTGDLSILKREIPEDPEDKEAKEFVLAHGGQNVVMNNPELVEEFAKKIHLSMSDQVMEQMQSNMEEILEENQARIEVILKENTANAVADTIKALASKVREQEAEQRLTCVQCDKEYRASANGPEACSFHKAGNYSGGFSCCGKNAPCSYSSHRAVHHCDHPYTSFYDYVSAITGYTDTVEKWATIEETNLMTDTTRKASVGKLLRWRSFAARISEPLMVLRVGTIAHDSPYHFHVYTAEALKEANTAIQLGSKSTVIFRSQKEEDEFEMAEWTLNDAGVINGIKLTCRVSTSDTASVTWVPINIESASKDGEIKILSKAFFKSYKPAEPYELPETRHKGFILPAKAIRAIREFKPRTSLPLVVAPQGRMVANMLGQYVRNNADKFQGTLRFFNKSSPASDKYVIIASATAEYRFVGDEKYSQPESFTFGDIKFPATIGPTQSLDIPYEVIVRRDEEHASMMLTCWNWALIALHRPVRVRFTFKDIEDEKLVIIQEYIHQPTNRLSVKEESDLLFLHIDDALEGSRSCVRIKRADDESHVINVNGNRLTVQDLNRIVYQAEKAGQSEYDLNYGRDSGSYKWKAWALVDLSCRRVYGFKMLLERGSTSRKNNSVAMGYAACPIYESHVDEDGEVVKETEMRPIRYADEKIKCPEVEVTDALKVIEDDGYDDEKPLPPPPTAVVSIAAAAVTATAATAAISEVAKATSSLDTAVFSSSMTTLEKRLESLDVNVARMATALEKLVDILSQ
ncbi:hypothetical protein BGW38_001521 [Lunasporangiospora selenospora]|uniref:Uncharacterized protein n=1 Tax=Lunasporangiospora selenospora TaxID=979761 RepID=A0A9P6FU75_9FUNG|nr:hypothetical protein BGW38_001521 [Lunasporangiospora selenospora]